MQSTFFDGDFHFYLMNWRWNHCSVTCPRSVSWISFIFVVLERVHGICKDPNNDGSPLDWRFWSPEKKYHRVLLLQVIPSYFTTVPISERALLIFTPNIFCYRKWYITAIYWWIFGGEVVLLLNLWIHIYFNVWSLVGE